MKKRYAVLVGAVVLGMMAFGVANASALAVSPAGAFTGTQGTISYSTKSKLTCSSAAYKGMMSASGVGTFEKEGISMSGCHMLLGLPAYGTPHEEPVSMQPLSTWNFTFAESSSPTTDFPISVSNVLLRFALTGAPGCAFYIGGSWGGFGQPSGTVRSIGYANYKSTLKVTQISSCASELNMASLGESVTVSSGTGIQFPVPFQLTR